MQVVPLEEIHVWEDPELFPYGHDLFASHLDYVFLFTVFNILLNHEHTSVERGVG